MKKEQILTLRVQEFLDELTELSRKYNIALTGSGYYGTLVTMPLSEEENSQDYAYRLVESGYVLDDVGALDGWVIDWKPIE